jgi:PAS domain-containing protein
MSDQRTNSASDESGVTDDLSDSQQQAERLELENKMLRGVLDSMADNISIKDLKGRYIFDNAASSSNCAFFSRNFSA